MEVQVNYVAVLLAMLSSMVVGSVWYAQSVFGNVWAKLARIDMKKQSGNVARPMIMTALASLLTAYVLAHVTYLAHAFFNNTFMMDALTTAFWLWLGLVAARFITHDAFEGRPWKLTAINLGNEFVTLIVMGLVIGTLGVN